MIKRIRKIIPENIINFLKVILNRVEVISFVKPKNFKKLFCPICEKNVEGFYRLNHNFLKTLDDSNFIFSVYHFETLNTFSYACPNCGAVDRERLFGLYLKDFSGINKNSKFSMLDFAPSKTFYSFIKNKFPNINYRSADLCRKNVDDNIDITEMKIYEDERFDFIICSHILEHVNQDEKAMSELYRVLNKNGKAIIMVPIMLSLSEDYENKEVITEMDRWKHFGQYDHVRMYSKQGFLEKLKKVGFKINQFDSLYFGPETFGICGIHQRSVLYVVEK